MISSYPTNRKCMVAAVESEDYREFLEEHLPKGEWHRRILLPVVGYRSADGFCFEGFFRPWFSTAPGKRRRGTSSWKITRSQEPEQLRSTFFFHLRKACSYGSYGSLFRWSLCLRHHSEKTVHFEPGPW